MHPRSSDKVLILTRELAPRVTAQTAISRDGPFKISVEPTRDVESRNLDTVKPIADILRRPIVARFAMFKPVANVSRQRRINNRRMRGIRRGQRLRPDIGPRSLQSIACIVKFFAPRVLAEHLDAPSQARTQPQCTLVVKPTVVKIGCGHMRRNAHQTLGLLRSRQQLRCPLVGKAVHPQLTV